MKRVVIQMTKMGTAPGKQLLLPFVSWRGETHLGEMKEDAPVKHAPGSSLLERVVERSNMFLALDQVMINRGCRGVDGRTVDELPAHLKEHWPRIREELRCGSYKPQPVKRVSIPKPCGGERQLGVPTVVDRPLRRKFLGFTFRSHKGVTNTAGKYPQLSSVFNTRMAEVIFNSCRPALQHPHVASNLAFEISYTS